MSMRIIEIATQENGSHRNQSGSFVNIPDGWAEIPDDMETPNFPFGKITVKSVDIKETVFEDGKEIEKVIGTKKVVTKWVAGTMPEVEPTEEPINEIEQLRADIDYIAIMAGVEL